MKKIIPGNTLYLTDGIGSRPSLHILLLTTYFKPDITANGILMTQLAAELAELGHRITVITSMPHYSTNRIWPEYRGRLWTREQVGKLDVIRLYLYVPQQKSSLLGRLLNYLSFNMLSAIAAFIVRKVDLIFIPSPPLTNGLVGVLLQMLRGIPFIYNVQDIYPDVAIRLGVLTNPRAIALFQRLERFVYAKSAAVSVISHSFRRNLLAKDVPEAKVHVIPNFVDLDFIQPVARQNAFSSAQGLNDCFVLLFAGNIGLSQGLEYLLTAAQLLQHHENICLLIVGNGTAKPALVAQAEAQKLTNVRFLPYQPHESVANMYGTADICLVPLRHGIAQESVPSKVLSILGAARPLIAAVDRDSDTAQLIQDARCGLRVEPEDPQQLANAVLQLYGDRKRMAQMAQHGHQFIQARYTKQHIAQQYAGLFHNAIAAATGNIPASQGDTAYSSSVVVEDYGHSKK